MSTFIAIEGIEGSGKSTLSKGIAERLSAAGQTVVRTREPGATELGLTVRELLLKDRSHALDPHAELMLFFADRAQHIAEVIRPALSRGETVLTDRYCYSTLAYQGFGRKIPLAQLQQFSDFIVGHTLPDIVLLLDLDPSVGLSRAHSRAHSQGASSSDTDSWNRFEAETLAFHQRIREGFLSFAKADPVRFLVLDATASSDSLLEQALERIAQLPGGIRR